MTDVEERATVVLAGVPVDDEFIPTCDKTEGHCTSHAEQTSLHQRCGHPEVS